MSNPVAVLISDVHYSLPTLKLADAAMSQAVTKANELAVPLIVAGDLHDTKANLRGECVNAMLSVFSMLRSRDAWILRGNHDALNEKTFEHSLNFLKPLAKIVEKPILNLNLGVGKLFNFIPYYHDVEELRAYLKTIPAGSTLIMHQGIEDSHSGDYIQDKSAIMKQDVAGFRVISGHYHRRQTIELPDNGKWDYIGNPYTLSYGESNDPPKGFQILMDDGTLEFVPTNIRKHVVITVIQSSSMWVMSHTNVGDTINPEDLIWIKVLGNKEDISVWNKQTAAVKLELSQPFRLDLIPTDTTTSVPPNSLSQGDLLDSLIDSLTNTSEERKTRLKQSWKDLCE